MRATDASAVSVPPVGVDTFLDMIGLDRSSLATNRLRSASRTPQPAGS